MIRQTFLALTLVASATLVGCGPAAAPPAPVTNATAAAIKHTITVPEESLAKLAEADHADGQDDKTIHKCYVCGLGMDGKAENSVSVNGYVAHFCSPDCCDHFAKEAVAVITDTKIPPAK